MRLLDYTIPADFQDLDDATHVGDRFANVRDLQMLRKNHNVIVAKRLRRPLLTQTFGKYDSAVGGTSGYGRMFKHVRAPSVGTFPVIMQQVLYLTQHTQTVRVVIRACESHASAAPSAILIPMLQPLHVHRKPLAAHQITVSAAYGLITEYGVTIEVPHTYDEDRTYARGRLAFEFLLYMYGRADSGESEATGIGITAQGPNWVEPSGNLDPSANLSPGDILYCDSDYRVESRSIVRKTAADHGSHNRYYVDRPWARAFVTGTDTLATRHAVGVFLKNVSVYESAISDFHIDAPGGDDAHR